RAQKSCSVNVLSWGEFSALASSASFGQPDHSWHQGLLAFADELFDLNRQNLNVSHLLVQEFNQAAKFARCLFGDEQQPDLSRSKVGLNQLPVILNGGALFPTKQFANRIV